MGLNCFYIGLIRPADESRLTWIDNSSYSDDNVVDSKNSSEKGCYCAMNKDEKLLYFEEVCSNKLPYICQKHNVKRTKKKLRSNNSRKNKIISKSHNNFVRFQFGISSKEKTSNFFEVSYSRLFVLRSIFTDNNFKETDRNFDVT